MGGGVAPGVTRAVSRVLRAQLARRVGRARHAWYVAPWGAVEPWHAPGVVAKVQGLTAWVRVRIQGSGFRVQGSGFRVQGSGFRFRLHAHYVPPSGAVEPWYALRIGLGGRIRSSEIGVEGLRLKAEG